MYVMYISSPLDAHAHDKLTKKIMLQLKHVGCQYDNVSSRSVST